MRETFVRGNEFYAGQKPNGAIARILKDHTWSDKYQKVVPHKGRYALLFQDTGGGGQVIAFAPEQLEAALSDLKQQGYVRLVSIRKATQPKAHRRPMTIDNRQLTIAVTQEPWQMTKSKYLKYREQLLIGSKAQKPELYYRNLPPEHSREMWKTQMLKYHKEFVEEALLEGKSIPQKVLREYPDLIFAKMDVHPVSFNSHSFVCYGKQTKRGFRAYCAHR